MMQQCSSPRLRVCKMNVEQMQHVQYLKQTNMATLYLDTETNGPLPPRDSVPTSDTYEQWPRMVQLAFQVVCHGVVVQEYSAHVSPDSGMANTWSAQAEAVNHISQAYLAEHGHSTSAALAALADALDHHNVTHIVAHNMEFDSGVLSAEIVRKGQPCHTLWQGRTLVCTMKDAAYRSVYGTPKWQKLAAAYQHAVGAPWDEAAQGTLHDAAADVECLKQLHEAALVKLGQLTAEQKSTRRELVHRTADVAATLSEFASGVRSRGGLNLLRREIKAGRLRVSDVPGLSPPSQRQTTS